MESVKKISLLEKEIRNELTDNILNYWINNTIDPNGGFIGQILSDNTKVEQAPKGAVLNARILWTFSAAYNLLREPAYLEQAERAYNYLINNFIDKQYGGVYWQLDFTGKPLDSKKQIYALSFAIYGLSEYYIASRNPDALSYSIDLFQAIEEHSFDPQHNGYFEAYSRTWELLSDLRLSDKDANEAKTMNTHLHVLEAYTNLYRIWDDPKLKMQLENLLQIHFDKILDNQTFHFNLFFDEKWNLKSNKFSYGHDIEGAWLMLEAAKVLANKELIEKAQQIAINIAKVTIAEGQAEDGSIYNDGNAQGIIDLKRDWWPQAEAMVGFYTAYEINNDSQFIEAVLKTWEFTKKHIISPNGEWWWGVDERYQPLVQEDKVGMWKCPYHNSRACMELLKRFSLNLG